jgi:hypothetical protein
MPDGNSKYSRGKRENLLCGCQRMEIKREKQGEFCPHILTQGTKQRPFRQKGTPLSLFFFLKAQISAKSLDI